MRSSKHVAILFHETVKDLVANERPLVRGLIHIIRSHIFVNIYDQLIECFRTHVLWMVH